MHAVWRNFLSALISFDTYDEDLHKGYKARVDQSLGFSSKAYSQSTMNDKFSSGSLLIAISSTF